MPPDDLRTHRGRGVQLNTINRFTELAIELDPAEVTEDDLRVRTRYLDDSSRSVISTNTSPDLGFDASLNPYRGCEHGCSYCLDGSTVILMGDGSSKPLSHVEVGDDIVGTVREGHYRRLTSTRVLDRWTTVKPSYRIVLADGTELVASGDHRFLTERGWKHVTDNPIPGRQRPHLTLNNKLMGWGSYGRTPLQDSGYMRGYLTGMIRGDGHLAEYKYTRPRRAHGNQYQFRLAVKDEEALRRTSEYLLHNSVTVREFEFTFEHPTPGVNKPVHTLRVLGGSKTVLRFAAIVHPAISRKRRLTGMAVKSTADLRVVSIEPHQRSQVLHDITTGTGDFIANGVVSHNCYARPTHEYLGLSAGLDFERVIMVKRNAAALLEEQLRSSKWRPRVLMLSGVTDPYQPIERRLRVTRSALEVLARFRNPVSLITKNALVARDIDVLAEMAAWNGTVVTISITTLDEDLRAKLEPRTATIAARFRAMRDLAAAGVPVGVNMAPIIPGLTDHEVNDLLAKAADAGASHAHYTLLRLPGAVTDLFTQWLEDNAPLRKEKVLNRVREVHGGVLDDRQFGRRMRGGGTYAAQLGDLFRLARRRAGIPNRGAPLNAAEFRVPGEVRQGSLFDVPVE